MAAASEGEDFFALVSIEEKGQISENLAKKLQDVWTAKLKELTNLKVESEKERLNADQEKFQLEKQLVSVRGHLEEETHLKVENKKQKENLENKLFILEEELQQAKAKVTSLKRELEHSQNEREDVSSHSAAMAGNLESRTRKIQELQEEVHKLSEQLSEVSRAKCEAVIQAEEAHSQEMQMKYREKRLEQEHGLLSRQMGVLQHQLELRAEESLNQRREHSSIILGLQTDVNHKTEEVRVLKEEKAQLEKQLEEKSKKIQELLDTLNASRESEVKLEEAFRQELSAQKKLTDIYQASTQNEKERAAELENGVEELRKLLQEASDQYGALESTKNKADEEHEQALRQSNLLVKDLKEELEKVNMLLEANAKKGHGGYEELSPAANAASQLVSRGLSLTQLYSEYLSVSEKFMATEEENKRLKRYVDQILQEIEERVPVLKKQRDDHQRSLETITSLHAQLDEALVELEKRRLEADEARRRTNYLERENKRLDGQMRDLSKQVTILVSQVEAARAGLPPPPIPKDTSRSPTVAGDVISQRLVAFRDIAELQEQNNNLRVSLRDLSEQMEAVQHTAVDAKTKELQEELESAKAQLKDLSAARERQETMMENLVHQRDMYRTLLSQQTPKTPGKPVPPSQTPQPSGEVSQQEIKKAHGELEKAKKEINTIKKEHEDYRAERLKNEKMMQSDYDSLRATMEKTRNQNIKLVSQAEYNDERIKTLQNNNEVLQRQIASLEKNNTTLQGIVGRHEGSIETLRSEYMSLQKKLSRAEVTVENLREEKTLLKESEARLLAERESLNQGQMSQAMVLANLESIKINLERRDSDGKMRYENQVATLTEQVCRLKAKLASNSDLRAAENKVSELEGRIRAMHTEHSSTTKQLLEVRAELSATKSRMNDLQERARVIPSPGPRARGTSPMRGAMPFRMAGPSPQVRDLEMQLVEEKAKVNSLQGALDHSKRFEKELLELNKKHEAQLAESNEACKTANEEYAKLQKELQATEAELTKLESQLRDAIEEGETAKTLLKSKLAKTEDELQVCRKQLSDVNEALEKAKEDEEKSRKEAQEHSRIAAEVQDKYEREVMLHGADLKALATLKERQAEYNTELQEATSTKLKAEEAVRDTRLGFEERENVLRRENKDLLARSHELEEQNKSILDQFTQLSDKMAAIQTKLTSSVGEAGSAPFTEDEARSSDQLREIIKFLRREREVATGKCEVAQAENLRLESQRNVLKTQLDQVSKNLSEEREKNQVAADNAGHYSELLRKVHTLDALADSNRLMREEKEGLLSSNAEYKAKYETLEKQIEPLQEKQRLNINKIEALLLEKKSLENEREMYRKRTQELVEKLNRAKPEDFVKLQQEVTEQQKLLQSRESEINRLKNQLAQLSKNQQMIVNQKNQYQQQLHGVREELRKANEEVKKNLIEKNRLQQQHAEENKKTLSEKARLQQQMLELKQREELQRHQLEMTKKEAENLAEKLKDAEGKLAEAVKKADNFEKQSLQLRKIATKYKKAAEVGAPGGSGDGTDGEASTGSTVVASSEKIKELEETISTLRQKHESTQEECTKLQQEITTIKQSLSSKELENGMLKSQSQQKDGEVTKLRVELEGKTRELQIAQNLATQLKQNVSKQITDITKRLEESQSKKQLYENRINQLEKERDQLAREVESHNKKLQMQQRQLENLQKQAAGASKPSTSGVSSEKSGFEPPPTANIKPMNAPVAPSASPRSQAATQVVPPSRAIPTASIRPMAPPSGGSAPPQGSTVMVVSPLETHSDGMVSSTVTLPQATVTPTPAISAPTILTTATTTPSATTTMTTTLTATVSPTPASASLTTPVASAVAIPSITASQSSSQSSTATQSTLASQSSAASQSTTVVVESTPATQSTAAAQSTPTTKSSGLQTATATSSTVASQSTLANQSTPQTAIASTSVVAPIVSVATGASGAIAVASSKTPTASAAHIRQQESQEVSADALVSQAIALVSPLSSQEVAGPSGITSQKRKLESAEAVTNTKDAKRSCLDEDALLSAEEAGPSSSHAEQENDDASQTPDNEEDVILLESDDENEEYADQGDDDEEEEDEEEEEEEEDDEQMDDEDQDHGIHTIDTDDDEDDEAMEHDETTRECSQGLDAEAGQNTREAEEDLGNADAEAEAASQVSVDAEDSRGEAQETPSESERPQPSAGLSQPSSSSRGDGPAETSPRTPLVLPRPIVRQERLGSVGRQTLAPFSQLPQYDEGGDDSIVPSTPTLFVPRRGDGFSEAVSSPQVPSAGFVFGSNTELSNPPQTSGLAQMAEGGLIDDTRIDLGQLDEGNRSQPSTPLHRSPTADLGAEGGVSTSEGDAMHREPPTVMVTEAEQSNEENSKDSEENFTEADSMAAEVGEDVEDEEDDDAGAEADDDVIDLEEDDEGEEAEANRQAGEAEERIGGDSSSQPAQDVSSVPSSTPSSLPSSSQQRRITPITWDESPRRIHRGRGLSMSRGGRGLLRTPAMGGRGFNPLMHAPFLMRGGPQRARRSRPGPFPRGSPM
ncbi:nucleoprotein TPR-like isoform X2 [Homarus americanus]|uniref:nucleoprotein TPR-like isoform X2 n=1 Tax=Homarus americanus TaxID=6706 RepID=UPI001C48791E|nr:nucleoprotein TPR-like isoform X2 [Homarus americanus]